VSITNYPQIIDHSRRHRSAADFTLRITWRGYGIPSKVVVVCPIIPMNSNNVLAFLVLALNPYRPYDEDYRGFIDIITHQITTPQLSAVILREEVERRAQLARQEALDRDRLYKELSESESKFARFARRAPIGLGILKPDGTALSANGESPIFNLPFLLYL
jgi:hypothetical protein